MPFALNAQSKTTSRASSAVFSGASVASAPTAPSGAADYSLWPASTGAGSDDSSIAPKEAGTTAAVIAPGVPTNGETACAGLTTKIDSVKTHGDLTFTAASVVSLMSPTEGSVLAGPSVTFTWSSGGRGCEYNLWLGSTGIGSFNLYASPTLTTTSVTATRLPTNGETIYARLYTNGKAQSRFTDYTFKAGSTPTLSALSCSAATITGSGTIACAVALSSPTASDLNVSLSTTNSAVAVPATVTVPANATTSAFTAVVSTIKSASTATLAASVGSVSKTVILELAPAVPTLSISATSLAFGDVTLNTVVTQSLTLTSTGTSAVTISSVKLTGSGFAVSGAAFPITLDPGASTKLTVQFDPSAIGTATGQLTLTSNSSSGTTTSISLSGTATAAIAVGITPSSTSVIAGTNQQFVASVSGTSNTLVNWAVSGTGCSGANCGTISPTGLYTAPTTTPSPDTVTITATSQSEPTASSSAAVSIISVTGTIYHLAPASNGGDDSNDGLSNESPWLTPGHPLNCGDVIIAAPGSYGQLTDFGTVACAGGNNVAWLICATFDTCKINVASGGQYSAGIEIGKSFWGVQGWEVTTYSGGWGCYVVYPATSTSTIHHIIFANDIANGCGQGGFGASPNGSAGVDYLAVLGSIAFNSVQGWTNCTSGFNVFKPVASDTLPGTHYLFAGDFAWNNVEPETCNGGIPTDGQGFFLDTTQPYSQQMVVENNLSVFNGGSGLKSYNNSTGSPNAPIYFRNNTTYGNETGGVNGAICSEIALQSSLSTEATGNLAVTSAATGCYGESALFALGVSAGNTTDEFSNNYGYSAAGNNTSGSGTGFEFASSNLFGADPMLTNPVQPSAPSCGGTNNVPECMAQVIANFTPTNPAASDYGRQIPSTANISDPLFPAWLCNTKLPQGLVSMGCAVN